MSEAKIRVQLAGMPREYTLPRDPGAVFIIGRGKDANLQFESTPEFSYVSNRHCHIRYVGDGYVVIDGSVDGKPSSAGTFVNGMQVYSDGKALAMNDEIRLGNLPQSVKIQFVMDEAVSSSEGDYMATNIYMSKPPTPVTSQPPVVSPPPQQPPQNPFGSTPVTNPYGMPNPNQPPNPYAQPPNPYGQPNQPPNPYAQPPNPYGQPNQPPQQNPYGQPNQPPQNPYGQPQNPYGGQPNPYGQPQNPYGQPPQNPYGQPPQNPYGQPQMGYSPYGQPQIGYGGYAQANGGFSFIGLIVSALAGAILFGLYHFIMYEMISANTFSDGNLLNAVLSGLYSLAVLLVGIVLSQTVKPLGIVTVIVPAILVAVVAVGMSLVISSIQTDNLTVPFILLWVKRVLVGVVIALGLSKLNPVGNNGDKRLSFAMTLIVIVLWSAFDWLLSVDFLAVSIATIGRYTGQVSSILTSFASNQLLEGGITDPRLIYILIGTGLGALVSALLFFALSTSKTTVQKQVMYQQQPPYGQYPPYR